MSGEQVSKRERTKEKIYTTALKLFIEQGYEQSTVEQIAQQADIAKGTFFNYFETKEAILQQLADENNLKLARKLKNELYNLEHTQEKLTRLCCVVASFYEFEKELKTILVKEGITGLQLQMISELVTEILQKDDPALFLPFISHEHTTELIQSMISHALVQWSKHEHKQSLQEILLSRLNIILNGCLVNREAIRMDEAIEKKYDVLIVGGGLAGLSAAAYLASKGKKILLLERGSLGGRAVTLKIKDFSFNFGAHAIYGRDTSILRFLERELGIKIEWRDFSPHKAKYDIGTELTDVPANVAGLFRTKAIKGADKIKFTFEIFKTLIGTEKGHQHLSIKRWMEEKHVSKEVQEMMLTLGSSNFFTSEPEKIPSTVFFDYYKRLFSTNKPVAYIGGGWQALINEFVRVIEHNDGVIVTKEKVEGVEVQDDQVTAVLTNKSKYTADEFLFCIPPAELNKLFSETRIQYSIKQYTQYKPSYVYVYDVGLKERIDVPYTYVYDKKNRTFITDISFYDETCVPQGGQLLQAIAYIKEEDLDNPEIMQEYQNKIESLYDKHFKGWRDVLVVPRISKRAAAQEIKWTMNQQPMPIFFPDYRNLFFAGDWCIGKGQLSELSFTSAYEASQLILQK